MLLIRIGTVLMERLYESVDGIRFLAGHGCQLFCTRGRAKQASRRTGQDLQVAFNGKIESQESMKGDVDFGGMAQGTWTAKKRAQ